MVITANTMANLVVRKGFNYIFKIPSYIINWETGNAETKLYREKGYELRKDRITKINTIWYSNFVDNLHTVLEEPKLTFIEDFILNKENRSFKVNKTFDREYYALKRRKPNDNSRHLHDKDKWRPLFIFMDGDFTMCDEQGKEFNIRCDKSFYPFDNEEGNNWHVDVYDKNQQIRNISSKVLSRKPFKALKDKMQGKEHIFSFSFKTSKSLSQLIFQNRIENLDSKELLDQINDIANSLDLKKDNGRVDNINIHKSILNKYSFLGTSVLCNKVQVYKLSNTIKGIKVYPTTGSNNSFIVIFTNNTSVYDRFRNSLVKNIERNFMNLYSSNSMIYNEDKIYFDFPDKRLAYQMDLENTENNLMFIKEIKKIIYRRGNYSIENIAVEKIKSKDISHIQENLNTFINMITEKETDNVYWV